MYKLISASPLANPAEGRAREACAWPGQNYARALLGNDVPEGAGVLFFIQIFATLVGDRLFKLDYDVRNGIEAAGHR